MSSIIKREHTWHPQLWSQAHVEEQGQKAVFSKLNTYPSDLLAESKDSEQEVGGMALSTGS